MVKIVPVSDLGLKADEAINEVAVALVENRENAADVLKDPEAMNEVNDALEQNREKAADVFKGGIVGGVKDNTHKLREVGLEQKLKRNKDETEFGFRQAKISSVAFQILFL